MVQQSRGSVSLDGSSLALRWGQRVRDHSLALCCNPYAAPAGILGEVAWPEGVRVDTWVETGSHVTPYYDSLLAKLMVFAPTRPEAIAKLVDALSKTKVRAG